LDDIEKESRAERLVNYANRTNDMRQLKTQQWVIVSYSLSLFAGIIGISSIVPNIKDLGGFLLVVMAIIVFCFSIFALIVNQGILTKNRVETIEMEKKFFTKLEYHKKRIKPTYVTYWFHWQYWLTFKISIVIGIILTIWYMRRKFCLRNGTSDFFAFIIINAYLIAPIVIMVLIVIYLLIKTVKKRALKIFQELHFYD
jgi:hypothetical protein